MLEEDPESRAAADIMLQSRILEYIRDHGSDLSFTKAFWKDCEPHQRELNQYPRYVQVLSLHKQGFSQNRISAVTGVKKWSVAVWIAFRQRPTLGYYLRDFLLLGHPREGWRWLSVNNSSGHAVPFGPYVQVPLKIGSWDDIESVISNLDSLGQFSTSHSKAYMFGFLLGITIGDAAKKRQESWHRHLELTLSMKYDTNERIGNFTCDCANAVGLRMQRMPNKDRYGNKPHGFFVWESQSSALVDWIFNCCLGLRDGELTTYMPVNMDWALQGPDDFRRGLVQGMAESDGSVNISGQEVEFWIGPSWDFVKTLLKTFGLESFRSRMALAISKSQVAKALRVPIFSPYLQTVRYQKFVRLATARHISRGKRIPIEIRERISEIATEGLSMPLISERILDEFGIILTYEAIQRWAGRALQPRGDGAQ